MIGDHLEKYTFEYLITQALAQVPDDQDKRQGSIIYDAIAPACYSLAEYFNELRQAYKDTFVETATGDELDLRVREQGLERFQATQAIKRADFENSTGSPIAVPLGSRFYTISDTMPVIYSAISPYTDEMGQVIPGAYNLRCEEYGIVGNNYTGNLINISFVQGLASAEMSELVFPARDQESDASLRQRYFETVSRKSFAGNIFAYKEMLMNDIGGIGAVQVYPTWDGAGTVKCSIIDTEFNPVSGIFLTSVQNIVDPENAIGEQGDGLGLAPINHVVTISTPSEVTINVSAVIETSPGIVIGQVQEAVEEAIGVYIQELKEQWDDGDEFNRYFCTCYISRVSAAILSVPGVANVVSVQLNSGSVDIVLTQSGASQELPKLGAVVLSA